VGDVLQKLGRHFDLYSELLRMVRRDYLHFVTRFRDQAFDRFVEELGRYEQESTKRSQMDHFLDLYSQWLKTKDPQLEAEVRRLLQGLRRFDPEFGRGIFNDSENS
jgi:hypothetical protein